MKTRVTWERDSNGMPSARLDILLEPEDLKRKQEKPTFAVGDRVRLRESKRKGTVRWIPLRPAGWTLVGVEFDDAPGAIGYPLNIAEQLFEKAVKIEEATDV